MWSLSAKSIKKCLCSRCRTGISFLPGKGVEAHDHHAEDDEDNTGGPVEGLGVGLVGKDGCDARPQQGTQTYQSGAPPMAKWLTAPVRAVKVMMNTLVPTAVFSS